MKKWKRRLVLTICLALLCTFLALPVAAANEAPYQTYNMDKWGDAVPSPSGYLPSRSFGGDQLGCGSFRDASDLYYSKVLDLVFLSDSGNNRILVMDHDFRYLEELREFTSETGETVTLNNPQGIFVQSDGTIYICNLGDKNVLVCGMDGTLYRVIGEPSSNLLPEDFNYQPTKIVVDAAGRIYIVSKGTYQGLIYLEPDGSFIKFFGANDVEMTMKRRVIQIWKSILTDAAAATLQSFNPIEYGNIFLADNGYIYATAAGSEDGSNLITKLNPLGLDCLYGGFDGASTLNSASVNREGVWTQLFADVTVDETGIWTVIEADNGEIYQFSDNGETLFYFGGTGNQSGVFQRPVAIIEVEEQMYVLDAGTNSITEFQLTEYGRLVHDAIHYYDEGKFVESIEPWKEVISRNANYLVAYTGLGKAYYQLGDYETSMYYYKLGNNRSGYSQAYKEYSLNAIRNSFGMVVLAIVVVVAALVLLHRYLQSRDEPVLDTLVRRVEGWQARRRKGEEHAKVD